MRETPELREAIEGLYSTFSGYPLRDWTDPCPCCHKPGEEERIHSKPLRQLNNEDLDQYSSNALFTWGGEDDFKHFLPRLFELVIHTEDSGLKFADPQVVIEKLSYATWHTWPVHEQKAISHYIRCVWRAVLETPPEELAFDGAFGWLCSIAQAEENLEPYLGEWIAAESLCAHRHLARLVVEEELPSKQENPGAYWTDCAAQWNQLIEWLRQPCIREKLARGVDAWADTDEAKELLEAAARL